MTKRLKILIAIFFALLTLVFFSVYQDRDRLENNELIIAISDTSLISKIEYLVPGKEPVRLKRTIEGWFLNDSLEARSYLLNLFLAGINNMQVKREVAVSSAPEVSSMLRKKGIRVMLLNERGRELASFYLSKNPNDPNSTYYMATGSSKPFVIFVPGFEGSLANIFDLPLSDWRTKLLFSSNERTLEWVEVTYPSFPDKGFSIKNTEAGFSIPEVEKMDTTRLYSYLNSFLYLTLNNYLNNTDSVQQLLASKTPLAILKVKNLREEKTLLIYEDKGQFVAYLPDQKEYVSLRQDLYNRILVKRSFFRKTD